MSGMVLSALVTVASELFQWGYKECRKKRSRNLKLAILAMSGAVAFFAWILFFHTGAALVGAGIAGAMKLRRLGH